MQGWCRPFIKQEKLSVEIQHITEDLCLKVLETKPKKSTREPSIVDVLLLVFENLADSTSVTVTDSFVFLL